MRSGFAATSRSPSAHPRSVHDVLEAVLSGECLDRADADLLIHLPGSTCRPVLEAAASLRDRGRGATITYSPKVFLPVTNLCRNHCAYCTFRRGPDDQAAWTMTRDQIRDCVRRGRALGCTEALFCLGDKPERTFPRYRRTLAALGHTSTVEYVREACEIALDEGLLPHTNMGVLTRSEMALLRPVNASLGLMLENISPRMDARGMPHYHSPDKDPTVRLRMVEEAGELAIPLTTGILIGIGESRSERVSALFAIRDLHQRFGHIQEVIIQNFRAKPDIPMAGANEPDGLEMACTIAVARLILGSQANIQAPPNLSPANHRLFLDAGINDWGGISPVTEDYVNPEAAWPDLESLDRTCSAAGFTLVPRLCIHKEFITPGWVDPTLIDRVVAMANGRRSGAMSGETDAPGGGHA